MAASTRALSTSAWAFSTSNACSASAVRPSAFLRSRSPAASAAASRFSSISEEKRELSNCTTGSPALTAAPSSASQRIWSWNSRVRGTERSVRCSASSSPVKRTRGWKVPRRTERPELAGSEPRAPASAQPQASARSAARSPPSSALRCAARCASRGTTWASRPCVMRPFPSCVRTAPLAGLLPARGAEVDLGGVLRPRRQHLEVVAGLEAHHPGEQDDGEAADLGVVLLGDAVEPVALDVDAVLRPLELYRQVAIPLHRLQLRVALGHGEQPAQGRGEAVLGLLELGELLRIVEHVGADGDLAHLA